MHKFSIITHVTELTHYARKISQPLVLTVKVQNGKVFSTLNAMMGPKRKVSDGGQKETVRMPYVDDIHQY